MTKDAFEPESMQNIPIIKQEDAIVMQEKVYPTPSLSTDAFPVFQDTSPVPSISQDAFPVFQDTSPVPSISQDAFPVSIQDTSVFRSKQNRSSVPSNSQESPVPPISNGHMSNLSFYTSQKPIRNKVSISMINPWFR
jgi:hypothetical protein